MQSFIERYTSWVDELIGDPSSSKRTTSEKRLRDLEAHHLSVYERLLTVSSSETTIGYTETNINIIKDQEFYRLPGNFRSFIRFERRLNGDPNNILDSTRTVAEWQRGDRGIIISSPERGFRFRPVPTNTDVWTLVYQSAPIILHWGTITDSDKIKPGSITIPLTVPEAQGEVVPWDEYYKGAIIHILEAKSGAGQSIEITAFNAATGECTLRNGFGIVPEIDSETPLQYEFRTLLPRGYDKLIALSVAMGRMPERVDSDRWRMMKREWNEMFESARSYFRSTTSDRPQRVNMSHSGGTLDPFALP